MDKAKKLLNEIERAERELDNIMKSNSSLEDLEYIRYLQENISNKYLRYLEYMNV